jgi:proteasome accessory factor C
VSAGDDVARMLTIVPWFLERPGASLEEAAEAFGVSPRTIRRDLGHLDFCGLPGLGGGALFDVTLVQDRVVVSMADELRRPLRLTPREALRLVLSLQAVDEAFGDELPALRSAIDKVRRAADLPAHAAVSVGEGTTSGWLGALRRALRDARQVRLSYQGRTDDAPRDRVVDPWQLDVTPDGWYLHGHDVVAGDHRVFRLDRVADLEVLATPVTHARPDGPLPEPRFDPGDDALEVVVRLGRGARWLADAVDLDAVEDHGDTLEVRFRTDAPHWVARLLLMGAPDVEVRSPAEVADRLAQEARAALARYPSGN